MSDADGNGERQAIKSWSDVWVDLVLLGLAIIFAVTCLGVDVVRGEPEWFNRSGSVMVLLAGILGYRSLTRHWRKFFNAFRRKPQRAYTTSRQQIIIDRWTLRTAATGTVIWGYGVGDAFLGKRLGDVARAAGHADLESRAAFEADDGGRRAGGVG